MSTNTEWNDPPSAALWYGEVIVGRLGETTYFYGYSSAEEPPDVKLLVPLGWDLLEFTVKPTPKNPAWSGPEEEDLT